jgi:hypothetical protein
MDLAPALMGMRSQVRVFGVDPLDPACDRVVLRTEAPHRAFLPERVAGNVGSKHPADYEAARQALEASPDFRRVRDVDGLTIWESVRPATPATRPRAGSGNPDGRGARLLAG